MVEPLPRRALLAALIGLVVFGCAAPPPEKPIILRRPIPDRRAVRAPASRRPPASSPAAATPAAALPQPAPDPAPDPVLTPEQKADLFRQFDRYLAEPAHR